MPDTSVLNLIPLGYRQDSTFWVKKIAPKHFQVIDPFSGKQFKVKGHPSHHKWRAYIIAAGRGGKVEEQDLRIEMTSKIKVLGWLRDIYLAKDEPVRSKPPTKQKTVKNPAQVDIVEETEAERILEARGRQFRLERVKSGLWTAWLRHDENQPICIEQTYDFALGEIQLFLNESRLWEPYARETVTLVVRELAKGQFQVAAELGMTVVLASYCDVSELKEVIAFECELLKRRGYKIAQIREVPYVA